MCRSDSVSSAGGLVEDQHRGVLEQRAGDGQALALAAGEHHAVLADLGVDLGQAVDELAGEGVASAAFSTALRGLLAN
ncbi:hypothetical protein SSTU70S_03671 [Stutzerimonas stutzeri]